MFTGKIVSSATTKEIQYKKGFLTQKYMTDRNYTVLQFLRVPDDFKSLRSYDW